MKASQSPPRRWAGRLLAALLALFLLAGLGLSVLLYLVVSTPGDPLRGELPPADAETLQIAQRLREHVRILAGRIGERNARRMEALNEAADYLRAQLEGAGYAVEEERFGENGFRNLVAELPGDGGEGLYVLGAHYDSAIGVPGADDNASGAAALLEVARLLAGARGRHGIRFILFPNEERPYFGTDLMGSLVSATRAAMEGDEVLGMFSLEMLGYYSEEPGTQLYPPVIRRFYPDRGNFIAMVGNFPSRGLLHQAIGGFRATGAFRSEGMAAPEWLVEDIRRSDNSAYWCLGYPALMITDTSNFRNPHYHTTRDLPATLNFEYMARVVRGLAGMLSTLVG